MYPCSIRTLQADALFASALQRSDVLRASQIRRAIAVALDGYGAPGCAGRVSAGIRRPPGDRGRPDALGARHSGCPGRSARPGGTRSPPPDWPLPGSCLAAS